MHTRAARVGGDWREVMRRYSSVARSQSVRARHVRTYRCDAVIADEGARWNERWQDLCTLVARFDSDPSSVANPCVGARDFGGMKLPADKARAQRALKSGKWVLARCAAGVRLENTFFTSAVRR